MRVVNTFFPSWRDLAIHEGSPGWDIVSRRLATECKHYTASQYVIGQEFGSEQTTNLPCKSFRVEDFERQTFASESFDLVITQDVFEHIFRPDLAMKEIARTLKPGGATIITVPIVRGRNTSRRRASLLEDGTIEFHLPAEYHGNPVSAEGSLVTIDWGYDIVSYFQAHSGLSFMMIQIDDIDRGIRAELNEVLIGFKRPIPVL